MVSLKFTKIENSNLLTKAKQLSNHGVLKSDPLSHYVYLNIDDDFIHELFPQLDQHDSKNPLQKPDYFSEPALTGAHITLVYPNEPNAKTLKLALQNQQIDRAHEFEVMEIFKANLPNKWLYGLWVVAPSLEAIRTKFGLPTLLNYKDFRIPFHITIGVSNHF